MQLVQNQPILCTQRSATKACQLMQAAGLLWCKKYVSRLLSVNGLGRLTVTLEEIVACATHGIASGHQCLPWAKYKHTNDIHLAVTVLVLKLRGFHGLHTCCIRLCKAPVRLDGFAHKFDKLKKGKGQLQHQAWVVGVLHGLSL